MVGILLALAALALRRRRPPPIEPPDPLMAADLADLDERLAAIEAVEGAQRDRRLVVHVQPLVDRQVPARTVEAVPGLHAARVRFADGTAVLVRGDHPGDVARLAAWARRRSMVPVACTLGPDGTHVVFGAAGWRQTVAVVVTGLDQPD